MPHRYPNLRRWSMLLAVALLAAACGSAGSPSENGGSADDDADRLVIVTTVSPITNLVANVACDRAEVIGLVPEGVNSHTFEPRPSDAAILARADIVFVNGLNLELPTIELARANVRPGTPIVELAERTIGPDEWIFDFSFPREEGDPNPHLWTNPPYAIRFVEIIAEELSRLDPEGAPTYQANAAALIDRIEQLDEAIREATATVPPEDRKLLTYHDSFPYFAREHGWTVIGAVQPSDFSEPSARDIARLIDQIRAEGVPAIFGSEVFPSPVLEQIAAETGATYVDDLRDDDLPGEPGDPDHSYLGLMVFDIRTIVSALGGDPSPLDRVPTDNICDEASYGG